MAGIKSLSAQQSGEAVLDGVQLGFLEPSLWSCSTCPSLPEHLLDAFPTLEELVCRRRRGSELSLSKLLKTNNGKSCLARKSVTGQRSNQLNYVPPLFSPGCGKPVSLLSFRTVNRFACFNCFHGIYSFSGVKWTVNGQ